MADPMVIATNDLARIANGETLSVFLYNAGADLVTEVDNDDYFLLRYDMLQAGDIIICSCTTTTTPTAVILVVTAASSTTVTTALLT